jgi:hypothetical protein
MNFSTGDFGKDNGLVNPGNSEGSKTTLVLAWGPPLSHSLEGEIDSSIVTR